LVTLSRHNSQENHFIKSRDIMSTATFHNYPGIEDKSAQFHFSQAVVLGNTIRTSGQGGWQEDGEIAADPEREVELAFENVAKALKAANPNASWRNVVSMRSYHIDIDRSAELVIGMMRLHMPDHRPVWTCVEIRKLGVPGMSVEIEVEAVL
jgi:enamine deaminase RidA (YjgF/YER057c/UK114 family)